MNEYDIKIKNNKSFTSKSIAYLKLFSRDITGLIGLIIVGFFLIWTLVQGILEWLSGVLSTPSLAYILLPSNPFQINPFMALHKPIPDKLAYIFGTNNLGESILSRILYAMPRDGLVSTVVVLSAISIGAITGIISGYHGKLLNEGIMRLTDVFLALPALVLIILISVILHASFLGALLGLMVVWWPIYTRFFRAETIKIKNLDFMKAAELNRISKTKLFFKYLFLNDIDPVIAYAALDFGNVILTYSTLAFLGIGLTPPIPELGSMASNGAGALPTAWWWAIFPGVAILVIVIGFVFVGDRLQDMISNRINY